VEKKIGVLGGTFDPVHASHLALAEAAQREYCLDKILFVPAAVPPHKDDNQLTSFEHRVRMLEIACDCSEAFECNPIEGLLAKPSYTIDTLKALLDDAGQNSIFYFVIGCDAFLDILTWKSYREVLRLVSLIVSKRMGVDENELVRLAGELAYDSTNDFVWFNKENKKNIYFLKKIPAEISSTFIKMNITNYTILKKTIPEKVVEYIRRNGLYMSRKS